MKKLIFLLLIISFFILTSCNALEISTCNPIYAMDTVIEVKFYNVNDYNEHYQNIKKIYNEYSKLADDFETYSGYKNIYDLNNEREIEASNDLIELIEASIELNKKTNGYFNPLIGRLSHIWKDIIEDKTLNEIKNVDNELILNEISIMNSSEIIIEENIVKINGDANIDLGAIAKGFATYKCVEYLKNNNIEGYLINAGESSVALGTKGGNSFTVALQAPYSNNIIKNLEIKNTSIATSSGKHQHIIYENIRYHHIINPFTGYPSNIYDNVNVIIDNALYADCYSTAIFSMNYDDAINFSKNNNFDLILYKDNKILWKD